MHYNSKPLASSTQKKLEAEAVKFNHRFSASSDPELVDFIIGLNEQTLFEDIQSKADREELNQLFRYTKQEAEAKKDGLWAKCMCFSGSLMQSVLVHHNRWEKGLRKKLLGSFYKASFKGTATIGWFSGRFGNTEDYLSAGKMLARNWLLLTQDDAYIHPFGSLITNQAAYQQLTNKLDQQINGQRIWMIFRAGYSHEPARSFRLDTNEIILI